MNPDASELTQSTNSNNFNQVAQALSLIRQRMSRPEEDTNPEQNTASQISQNRGTGIDTRPPGDVSGNHDFAGLCEAYVEQRTFGHQGIYPTAIAAYNDFAQKGAVNSDVNKAPDGAPIYFTPSQSNGFNGHTGVSLGNGKMISATDNGVRVDDIANWEKSTGQKALGYVNLNKSAPQAGQ